MGEIGEGTVSSLAEKRREVRARLSGQMGSTVDQIDEVRQFCSNLFDYVMEMEESLHSQAQHIRRLTVLVRELSEK